MKRILLLLGFLFVAGSCAEPDSITSPEAPTSSSLTGSWKTYLSADDSLYAGAWNWSFACGDSVQGLATLETEPLKKPETGWQISWQFTPPLPQNYESIYLAPQNTDHWHDLHYSVNDTLPPIPLPRLPVISIMYNHLLELLVELTTPYFNQIVTHWPHYPIPVRLVPATNGPVDVAACLAEAMEIWNESAKKALFVLDSSAGWGVRLVHFPDREMTPPLAAQITRLDASGKPLRIHLLAGNDYNSVQARPYLVRGFVHELGHALFLWGHSMDRIHCLWGLAPPMVSEPSQDERKAVRWWHGLPEGLDISRYGIDK